MKFNQLEELYKISWNTSMLTHIILVNTVRVYRVTSDNFFPSKLISKNVLSILVYSSTQDLQNKKNNHSIWCEIQEDMNF